MESIEIENLKVDEEGYILTKENKKSWIHKTYIKSIVEDNRHDECEHYQELSKRGKVYTYDNEQWHCLSGRSGIISINEEGYGEGIYNYILN